MLIQNNLNMDRPKCAFCSGGLVSDIEKNESFCSNCGIVARQNYDTADHQILSLSGSDSDLESQAPTSIMMYDISLSTFIDKKNVDASGKQIRGYAEMEKLRKLNKFTISNDSKTRNLSKAMKEIRKMTEILGLSMLIAERASYIYRKALGKGLIKGRSIAGIAAATIYVACKDMGVMFPIDKIEEYIENLNKKNVVYYYKFLLRQMKMSTALQQPSQLVSRIAERARLGGKTQRKALEILNKIEGNPIISGKKPVSLAAGALYLAALNTGEHATQLRIAVAAELTTITIRKRYLEIAEIIEKSDSANSSEDDELPCSPIPCMAKTSNRSPDNLV